MTRTFPVWLGHQAKLTSEGSQIRVSAGEHSVVVDKVLAAMGRRSNVDWLSIENAGVDLNEAGLPVFDPNTMQCGDSRVFIAGDITASHPVLHEATNEGKIAGYNAARQNSMAFKRKTPFAITFTSTKYLHDRRLF